MILILSTPTDYDTNEVVNWLQHRKVPFFRLNDEDLMQGITSFNLNLENFEETCFEHYSLKIFIKDVKIVWYRKFGFLKEYEQIIGLNNDLLDYIYSEFTSVYNLMLKLLENKKSLCVKFNVFSKIDILKKANASGLKTPKTIITTSKIKLNEFYLKNNKKIITKSIGEAKYIRNNNYEFIVGTQKVENIDSLSQNFSPSLFQEHIDKDFEIRTFYLDKKCYSMAIFSQNNVKTKLDYRNYDSENPNRFVPYKLPEFMEAKIISFMETVGLNTGSLDLIKSITDCEYYFLEINPFGQFGMTSSPCNYNLHQKVANKLIEMNTYD